MSKTIVEKLSLRIRIFLFFALIGLGALLIITCAMVFAAQRIGDGALPHLVLFGGASVFAICGLTIWVWLQFDENVATPIERLSRDLRSITHGKAVHQINEESAKYLGFLAPAIREVIEILAASRSEVNQAIQNATREVELQKSRLEIVLRDLQEAVLICTLDHKILLYNRRALEILHISGDRVSTRLGLNRSLFQVVAAQPFLHALERLTARFESGRHIDHHEGLTTLLVSSTKDGQYILRGRLSLFLDTDKTKPLGYVATFQDITRELDEQVKRDKLLHTITTEIQQPLFKIKTSTEKLIGNSNLNTSERTTLENTLQTEASALSQTLHDMETEAQELFVNNWPMSDVYSKTLYRCAIKKSGIDPNFINISDQHAWLHCDSFTISELLSHLMTSLHQQDHIQHITLGADRDDKSVYLTISWQGHAISNATIDQWLDVKLDTEISLLSGHDILDRHRTDLWHTGQSEGNSHNENGSESESDHHSISEIRLPLLKAKEHFKREKKVRLILPERPEFYDFDLLGRVNPSTIDVTPISEATYVVFDTETTGLEPANGDEIVSIAGVRIVNGRVLRGEIFNELVNPGRRIPKLATQVHGISDPMVENAPDICTILKKFKQFVGDAILVAHNAAFDMKFLTLKQETCGIKFDNPVLDTVLLAAQVHGSSDSLTLDALSERYGITLTKEERHTALGDSVATAEVFLRLVNQLKSTQDVVTIRDALLASHKVAEIRRKQARAY